VCIVIVGIKMFYEIPQIHQNSTNSTNSPKPTMAERASSYSTNSINRVTIILKQQSKRSNCDKKAAEKFQFPLPPGPHELIRAVPVLFPRNLWDLMNLMNLWNLWNPTKPAVFLIWLLKHTIENQKCKPRDLFVCVRKMRFAGSTCTCIEKKKAFRFSKH
jgi:hypothetical protein